MHNKFANAFKFFTRPLCIAEVTANLDLSLDGAFISHFQINISRFSFVFTWLISPRSYYGLEFVSSNKVFLEEPFI